MFGQPLAETGLALESRLKRRIAREWLVTSSGLLIISLALSLFAGPLGILRLENTFYDFLLSHDPEHVPVSEQIAIIAIDDDSLDLIGYWPWRRSVHAELLARLGKARAVGLDLLFSESNPAFPDDDAQLARAIQNQGRVVLPVMADELRARVVKPVPVLAKAAAGMGHINIAPDEDGVIRHFQTQERIAGKAALAHLTTLMRQVAGDPPGPEAFTPSSWRIPYYGSAGYFRIYSYARVLNGQVPEAEFSGKYVLVGVWGSGLGDVFATPRHSENGQAMAGVEIMANILAGGLRGEWIVPAKPGLSLLLTILPVLAACLGFRRFSPQQQLLSTLILLSTAVMVSAALLFFAHIWWPPVASLIGLILSYPMWSWRSQQATLRHINAELALLDSKESEETPALRRTLTRAQSLAARMARLHHVLEVFRKSQQQQAETLRFLSHDMRAPLNSLMALVEHDRLNPDELDKENLLNRVHRYTRRTLHLVDEFVNLSRASAMDLKRQPVELAGLVAQCCDDVWVRARLKDIRLEYGEPEEAAWVLGDEQLISRAVINLLDNAVKYSNPGTQVQVSLTANPGYWRVCIVDQGYGMDSGQIENIFKPFVRLRSEHQSNPDGAGLGLAFVHTVMQRHQGRLEVDSQPGRGSRFCLSLAMYTPPPDPDPS